jgi:hypothetical protein
MPSRQVVSTWFGCHVPHGTGLSNTGSKRRVLVSPSLFFQRRDIRPLAGAPFSPDIAGMATWQRSVSMEQGEGHGK